MDKEIYQVKIGDNYFSIKIDEYMFNILKSTLSKDIEISKESKKEFQINAAKINAEAIYNSLNNAGWSIEGKLKFINEFIELIIKENNNEENL